MTISVFGLGYVGAVTAGCLARDGWKVIGVDVNPEKVAAVAAGQAPVVEPGLDGLLAAGVVNGGITATTDAAWAVAHSDMSFVSVGTPTAADGSPDMTWVERVCAEIGTAIAATSKPHTVVIRSTVVPGTTRRCAEILGQQAERVSVACNPEFLREGSALSDYDRPPYTVIGSDDPHAIEALRNVYGHLSAPIEVLAPDEAELLKAASNAWHATKIAFANEIGRLAARFNLDGRAVMRALVADTKLNISPAYLRPGFAYGGSCLPKDVRALVHAAAGRAPVLQALAGSNASQVEHALDMVLATGQREVGLLGLAFKPGTDDLRESPAVDLAERLLGKGCRLKILDHAVQTSRLVGANRAFVDRHLPHLADHLAEDAEALLAHASVLVVCHATKAMAEVVARAAPSVTVIDLSDLGDATIAAREGYRGIAW